MSCMSTSEEARILDEIAELVETLTGVQGELLEVLDHKRRAMADGDLVALERLQPTEEGIANRLAECHVQRETLLKQVRAEGMEVESLSDVSQQLSADAGMSENVLRKIEDSQEVSRRLRLEHLTNWVIAQKSLLHVSQMLEIIATGGKIRPTYGKEEFCARGSLVDHEA